MKRAIGRGLWALWLAAACGDDGAAAGDAAADDAARSPLVEELIEGRGSVWFENTLWADNQNLLRCAGCEYVGVVDLSQPERWVETFYAVTPGTSGVGEGERICSIEWRAGFSEVPGYAATERAQVRFASSDSDCLPGFIETPVHVLAVAARDTHGNAIAAALWQTAAGVGVGDPFPGYNGGVWAVPLAPCSAAERVPGRAYCEPLCDFDAPPCGAPAPP